MQTAQEDSQETGSFDRSGHVYLDGRAGTIENRHLDQVGHQTARLAQQTLRLANQNK